MPLWVGVLTQSTQRKRKPKKGPRCKITLIKLLKTRASKTLKAFNNIQCLRLLKASGAKKNKAAKHVKTPQRRTIKGFRAVPLVLYNKIWFIYLDIAQKSNTEADAFEHLVQTKRKKKEIALQSQCLVSTDERISAHNAHKDPESHKTCFYKGKNT